MGEFKGITKTHTICILPREPYELSIKEKAYEASKNNTSSQDIESLEMGATINYGGIESECELGISSLNSFNETIIEFDGVYFGRIGARVKQ